MTFSVSDNLSAVGGGHECGPHGDFNTSLDFTTGSAVGATVQLQRFRPGAGWAAVTYSDGTALGPFTAAVESTWAEPQRGVRYRWYCSAITSGYVVAELSQ